MAEKDGGPAYPRAPFEYVDRSSGLKWDMLEQCGMSQRDLIEATVLAGLVSNPSLMDPEIMVDISDEIRGGKDLIGAARALANTLLKAREGGA